MKNRRTFLKMAGVTTTLGITGFGPLACSPTSPETEPSQDDEINDSITSGQTQAVYVDEQSKVTVSLERIDVLIKDEVTVNFPVLLEFEDKMVLGYGRVHHGGRERRPIVVSTDDGKTWSPLPLDSPFEPASAEAIKAGMKPDPVESSGLYGFLMDGTTLYVNTFANGIVWGYGGDSKENQDMIWTEIRDPKFRVRRFSPKGDLMENFDMSLVDLPYEKAYKYELYGDILELDNGDLLAPFLVSVPPRDESPWTEPFRINNMRLPGMLSGYSTVIARSTDGGKTMHYLWHFEPIVDGKPVGTEGCSEPDLARLPNGDILCLMRTGSDTPMVQSRSKDDGKTWSKPVSVGWPGVKPKLRMLENGVLACSTGRGVYGHPQVTCAMVSIDGTGERWEAPFNFHTGPGCSYTMNRERNGKLEVLYSHSSFTKPGGAYGLPFQSIRKAVIDIKKEKRT